MKSSNIGIYNALLVCILILLCSTTISFSDSEPQKISSENIQELTLRNYRRFSQINDLVYLQQSNEYLVTSTEGILRRLPDEEFELFAPINVNRAFVSDNDEYVVARNSEAVFVWDISQQDLVGHFDVANPLDVWISSDGEQFAYSYELSSDNSNKIEIRFTKTNEIVDSIEFASAISTFTIDKDETLLITGHMDGVVNVTLLGLSLLNRIKSRNARIA